MVLYTQWRCKNCGYILTNEEKTSIPKAGACPKCKGSVFHVFILGARLKKRERVNQ